MKKHPCSHSLHFTTTHPKSSQFICRFPFPGSLEMDPSNVLFCWHCYKQHQTHGSKFVSHSRLLSHYRLKVKVEVKLQLTVSRPVRLGVRHPSGTRNQSFFLLEIFFRQLRVCYFVAPSLARVKVKVTLRPTISRLVRLGVRCPCGTRDQFFFLLEIFF
jgi:hypothetical protein